MSTSKIAAPVVGFNHNLKHAGRVFHVQTEDSGLPRAHFLTHLYIGGNILASAKGSYADKLDEPELPKLVRKMMEDQHKQMVRRLVAGEFTEMAAKFSPHYEPGVLADGHTGPAAVNVEGASPNDAAAVARLSPAPPIAAPLPAPAPIAAAPIAPPAAAPSPAEKVPSAPDAPLRMFEERPLPARTQHEQAPSTRMPLITREAESAATTLEEAFAAAAAQLADEGPPRELLEPPAKARPKTPPPASAPGPSNLAPPAASAAPGAAQKPISGRGPQAPSRPATPTPSILAPPTASRPSPLPAASASARPLPPAPAPQYEGPGASIAPPPAALPQAAAPPSSGGARKPPSLGGIAPGAFSASAGVTRAPGPASGGEYRLAGSEVAISSPGHPKAPPAKLADWEIPHDAAPARRPPPGQAPRLPSKPLRAPMVPDTVPEMPKVQPRGAAPSASHAQPPAPQPANLVAPPASEPPGPMHLAPPASSPPAPARLPGAPLPSTTRIAASSFRGIPPPLVTPVALVPRFAPQSQPRVPPVMQPIAPLPKPAPPNPLTAFADEARRPAPADPLADGELPPLFAEELISERSLDEVILAFLSSGDADKPK